MIKPELIEKAEAVSIEDYLASKGILPVKKVGQELVYLSPLRNENNASFYVNPIKNKFHDFTEEAHRGNAITLVSLMEKCKFQDAVFKLLQLDPASVERKGTPFLSATERKERMTPKTYIVFPFDRPTLIRYVEEERGIPYLLAKKYLYGVMLSASDRHLFYVGLKNNSGGFALGNKLHKRCMDVQDITTFDLPSRDCVDVFEGFFDFLAAMVHYGLEEPTRPTVVLNSVNNRRKAYSYLSKFNKINCFLDHDKGGFDCLRLLRRDGLPVKDCSSLYDGYKDFNDFLMKKPQTSV